MATKTQDERHVVGFADTDNVNDSPQVGERVRLQTTRIATITNVLDANTKLVQVNGLKGQPDMTITVREPKVSRRKTEFYRWWESVPR